MKRRPLHVVLEDPDPSPDEAMAIVVGWLAGSVVGGLAIVLIVTNHLLGI